MSRRWSAAGLLPAGPEHAVSELTGAVRRARPDALDRLYGCAAPRALEEHADRSGLSLETLRAAAADGLLVPEETLLDLARSRPRTLPPPPAALGVVTRDRPEELARCLAGFRAPEVVVCDDGREPPLPPGVRYAGAAEKAGFADALAAESRVPRSLVAFALGNTELPGVRTGGNRNALFLDLAGRPFVAVDDDVVARTARPASPLPGAELGSDGEPFERRIFADRAAALRAYPEGGTDLLAAHAGMLGRDLSRFDGLEIRGMSPGLLRVLRRDGGFVAVTMCGILGDCASTSAGGLLALEPSSARLLAGDDAAWALATSSREIVRVARRPLVTDQPGLMTYACGYDGRALLPPFLPFGRNADALFGYAVLRLVPGALLGHVPVAVLHAPAERRAYPLQAAGGRAGIAEFVMSCAASLEPSPGRAGHSYGELGRHLRGIAALDDAAYDDFVRRLLWNRASRRLERLDEERTESPGCDARRRDLEKAIETLRAALIAPDFALPSDVPGTSLVQRRARARGLLASYGELLEAWPALVDAALRLRDRGIRLSRQRASA